MVGQSGGYRLDDWQRAITDRKGELEGEAGMEPQREQEEHQKEEAVGSTNKCQQGDLVRILIAPVPTDAVCK